MRFTLFATLLVLGSSLSAAFGQSANSPTTITGSKYGTIQSDNFPNPYGTNIDKTWEIRVREGYRVQLYFTTFDLEDSFDEDHGGLCAYDYVQIEGYRKFCGDYDNFPQDAPTRNKEFKSTSNIMRITFVSDYSNVYPNEKKLPVGFAAHWKEIDVDECTDISHRVNSGVEDWDQILYCNHFCNNVPSNYYCSCRPGFTLSENKHTCIADCETSLTANEQGGSIESTDYPKPYGKLSNCITTITATTGRAMDVRFDRVFGIEEHYEEGCVYDYLETMFNSLNLKQNEPKDSKVKFTDLTDHRSKSRKYCGNAAPNNGSWIILNSNPIRIRFISDLTTEDKGYKLYYRTYRVRCGDALNAPTDGSVTVPVKDALVYKDKILFACDRGFRLVGSSVSVCTKTGEWSSQTPTCQIKYCPRPDFLLNIPRTNPPAFAEEERPFDSSLTIPCINQWYELVSGASEWFCDADETWKVRGRVVLRNENNNYPECRPICGRKNSIQNDLFTEQILNGRKARDGEWPWMAFIDIGKFGIERNKFCGGSLVDEKYVVTAAHCILVRSDELRVYLGVTDRFNLNNDHVQIFSVVKATNHPNYKTQDNLNTLLNNDIAVLELNASAVIGRYVRPICIPRSPQENNLPQNSPARGVVAGWGITELGSYSRVLRLVRVPFVNSTYCREVYNEQSRTHRAFRNFLLTKNHFCAGFLNRAKDSCDGDSGGPLMWRNQRRWLLNGIVSYGTTLESCAAHVIGIYTKVANYVNFLDNNIILAE